MNDMLNITVNMKCGQKLQYEKFNLSTEKMQSKII